MEWWIWCECLVRVKEIVVMVFECLCLTEVFLVCIGMSMISRLLVFVIDSKGYIFGFVIGCLT